ncbi:MAG TPA: amylo-alpha-1,6-glucosidase [Candidatus Manganitrophaceae bacterium]|nr:amylo-alpha-1,6-glucosidase [Candidatus Manganitrophaceae bacterium]
MDEEMVPRDEYYILTTPVAAGIRKLSLKQGEAFMVCDKFGNFRSRLQGELGFYFEGTRFLNLLGLRINEDYPLFLYSTVSSDDSEIIVDLTNPDYTIDHHLVIPRNTVFIRKRLSLYGNTLYQTLHLKNFHLHQIELKITLSYGADFFDVFEVRGIERPKRGETFPPEYQKGMVIFKYRGLDDLTRRLLLKFDPLPDQADGGSATFYVKLQPQKEWDLHLWGNAFQGENKWIKRLHLPQVVTKLRKGILKREKEITRIDTNNTSFNQLLSRSLSDIRVLETDTPYGCYPFAGIPWFVAPFGRDGVITSLEILPFQPHIARGALQFLAQLQGREKNAFLDEEPGKILHEYRKGEMANLREIPFIPYYGSVDATPLFLILLHHYVEWTGDLRLAEALWPNAMAALDWIRKHGDLDQDGYIEYHRESPIGLTTQGWKDSHDSVFHADGHFAESPIALVEAQGYVYAALSGTGALASLLGKGELQMELIAAAEALREKFNRDFWVDSKQFYALALDKYKRPCEVVTSNPGHCLWTGLIDNDKARAVADRLVGPDMFCGWGIRTVSEKEIRYNPMSYHNGGVWPHDNALILAGFKRYGFNDHLRRVATGLFESTLYSENGRLPELFCGFTRSTGHGPTPYPIACSPQAWSAASIFSILSSLLGLTADAINHRLYFMNPVLPHWLKWVEVKNLKVGKDRVDFVVREGKTEASVEVTDKTGEIEIITRR